ncbi:MAG: HAD family hydrolase [candidate division Zixibacteria bacterium]|jgi:D-glycero-D-manno-heptose 1,7-bisphosphate phosphatase|nr:HAD family hydrolase [candidate division Zixibacteria bacterium]
MLKRAAVFLDRDGVIIEEDEFLIDYSKARFIERSIDAIRNIPETFLRIIVSNQSGIARGYFTYEQVEDFNSKLKADLAANHSPIDEIYFCPHGPNDGCDCRKPKSGLFDLARLEYDIDYSRSWVIGDKSSDIQAGKNIGAKTILVLTGYAGKEPGALAITADYTAEDLYEAVEIIKK